MAFSAFQGRERGHARRPNRKAPGRRAQYQRADARVVQTLLRDFAALAHRGSQTTKLGAALQQALQIGQADSVERTSVDRRQQDVSSRGPSRACWHWQRGWCKLGVRCGFRHDEAERGAATRRDNDETEWHAGQYNSEQEPGYWHETVEEESEDRHADEASSQALDDFLKMSYKEVPFFWNRQAPAFTPGSQTLAVADSEAEQLAAEAAEAARRAAAEKAAEEAAEKLERAAEAAKEAERLEAAAEETAAWTRRELDKAWSAWSNQRCPSTDVTSPELQKVLSLKSTTKIKPEFGLRQKILGDGDKNMTYIKAKTGARVSLEEGPSEDGDGPVVLMKLTVRANDEDELHDATALVCELLEDTWEKYSSWAAKHGHEIMEPWEIYEKLEQQRAASETESDAG